MRTWQYLSLGDFGMCLFTYHFMAKNRPKETERSAKCHKNAYFWCFTCAGTILWKMGQNRQNRAREWRLVNKSKLAIRESSEISNNALWVWEYHKLGPWERLRKFTNGSFNFQFVQKLVLVRLLNLICCYPFHTNTQFSFLNPTH